MLDIFQHETFRIFKFKTQKLKSQKRSLNMRPILTCYFLLFTLIACNNNKQNVQAIDSTFEKGSYGYDANFIKKHVNNIIELQNDDAKILLCADYQGRVFTSTAEGDGGTSFGWINYNLLSSG